MGDDKSYTTDWLANETIRFLKSRIGKEEPFSFMVSIPDPHQPFAVRHPYDTMFDPLKMQVPESFYQKEIPDWAERDTWGRLHYFPWYVWTRGAFQKSKGAIFGRSEKCIDDNVGKNYCIFKEQRTAGKYNCHFYNRITGEYLGEHGLGKKGLMKVCIIFLW